MNLVSVLKRDVGSQFRCSRNLKETLPKKVARTFWVCVFLCKAFSIGCRAIFRECLGSTVLYKGRRCFISNWSGSDYPTLAADGFYEKFCPRDEIKNVINAREILHRFQFGFSFYTSSWMGIDVNKRLYGRLR